MKKFNISDILRKIRHTFTKKPERNYDRNPERDWLLILLYSSIACLAIAILDGYIFYKINRGELFNSIPTVASTVPTLNRTLLKQEIDFYKNQSTAASAITAQSIAQATSTTTNISLGTSSIATSTKK